MFGNIIFGVITKKQMYDKEYATTTNNESK